MTNYIDPAGKLLYHIDTIAAIRSGRIMPPINVEIDLTNRCSLGCEWCHFAYTHTRGPLAGKRDKPDGASSGGDVMNPELAKSILNQAAEASVKSVTFAGGGEPTLHPNFREIVGHAHYCGLKIGVYTHGGHIDHVIARQLKKLASWVYVSLDEASPEAYAKRKNTTAAMYHKAMAGIYNLAQAEGDATIGVGFLLHQDNYQDVSAMVALAKGAGADYVQFRPMVEYDMAAPKYRAGGEIDYGLFPKEGGFVQVDLERFERYNNWPLHLTENPHGYDICHWSTLQSVITPDGRVWVCCNKREFPGAALGDLTRESFVDIWSRRKAAKVNSSCRVMCRGHMPNLTLNRMMSEPVHAEFV